MKIESSDYMINDLTVLFDSGSKDLQDDVPFFMPAVEFEKKTGLKHIAKQWVLPAGDVMKELDIFLRHVRFCDLENSTSQKFHKFLLPVWRDLKKHNPELETLAVNEKNFKEIGYAVRGVISGFNLDDIDDFLHVGTYKDRMQDLAYKELYDHIKKTVATIEWVPSMKTLQKIEQQINNQRRLQQCERFDYS